MLDPEMNPHPIQCYGVNQVAFVNSGLARHSNTDVLPLCALIAGSACVAHFKVVG